MRWGKKNISLKNGENDHEKCHLLSMTWPWQLSAAVSTEVTSPATVSYVGGRDSCSLSCTVDLLTTGGFGRREGVLISSLPNDDTTRL